MDDQNKNLILATVLSFTVILVWFLLFPPPEAPITPADQGTGQVVTTVDGLTVPAADGVTSSPDLVTGAPLTREQALGTSARVLIDTDSLEGSISLVGGRIDDLSFRKYYETVEPNSPTVTQFIPAGAPDAYYAVYGWAPAGGMGFDAVPGPATEWSVESGDVLTPATPVKLIWDNAQGLIFRRTISVDDKYMFTVAQSVENQTGAEVRLAPYAIIARDGKPKNLKNFYILHEGVILAADGQLTETKYDAVTELPRDPAERAATEKVDVVENGWIGFTDHYWMATLVPSAGQQFSAVTKYTETTNTYQTDVRMPVVSVSPGEIAEDSTMLFSGPKEWATIRDYQKEYNIDMFIDAIDWGMFFFLTKPIFIALHYLHLWIGNMGWAIISLTLLIKAILFPLAYRSYVSMSKMKKLQPQMEKIKEVAGDDRTKMQQEVMALYKREKVNPAAGCLPIILQIPIFFSLYKVIFVTLELRQQPFFGWIKDLSVPDPSSVLNLFGLMPWAAPDPASFLAILSIGVWPILMGISMWLQMKLNPAPTDKTQAMIFNWMPWVFMFMLGRFASGLVIYWVANNCITFTQQFLIMRSQGVKPDILGNMFGFLKKKSKE